MKNQVLKELGITQKQLSGILLNRKVKKPKVIRRHLDGKVIKFGVVSDTQLCSVHEQLDELHTFYEICRRDGVEVVLHAGDMVSGWGIYRGQENEVHTFGADRQADYVVSNYPRVDGIETAFILGNHCESWWKKSGVDIGKRISEQRDDMEYLGWYNADYVLNGIKIQLHHGAGGGAYAMSYKGQKFAEQIPSGKKPKILILGHYHTAFYFWYRNMHILNAGCFEWQSLFLKRLMLNPAVGGWICTMMINEKRKEVISFQPAWIPFFT